MEATEARDEKPRSFRGERAKDLSHNDESLDFLSMQHWNAQTW